MAIYAVVAAKRIQTWLGETTELKLMRGASAALKTVTDNERWRAWAALHGASISPEGGNIDGVVVLEMAGGDARGGAALASELMAELEVLLPRLEWEGWAAPAEGYLAAFSMAASHDPSVHVVRRLPRAEEIGLAASCPSCRHEPADPSCLPAPDGRREGRDCAARRQHAGSSDLTFDMLARWGGPKPAADHQPTGPGAAIGRRDSSNHLATIAADGNGIGALFELIAERPELSPLRRTAVGLLSDCAAAAVEKAADKARGPYPPSSAGAVEAPVVHITHYVGGDDILVSVRAACAWEFVAELTGRFEDLRGRLREAHPSAFTGSPDVDGKIEGISLGVGMVFANASHPFADARRLAEEALHRAKTDTGGTESAIGWLDLTADGAERAGSPPVLAADRARAQLADPATAPVVFTLSASARANLAQLTRRGLAPAALEATVAAYAKRNGIDGLSAQGLADDLSRARWWPRATPDGSSDEGARHD